MTDASPNDTPPNPDGIPADPWRVPWLWRLALAISRLVIAPLCRLRVTGDVPDELRRGPLILAANHIGSFDPFVLVAACAKRRIAPRILATGGLFRAPIIGAAMRMAGHIRVDRRQANVIDALDIAGTALAERSVILAYPEGRITLDPGMRPERGKTGLARLAVATGVPVVPIAQWGAHLVLPWGAPRGMYGRIVWALVHRPIVRVHFGPPMYLGDVGLGGVGLGVVGLGGVAQGAHAIRLATDRIMDAIVEQLRALRTSEPRLPGWADPQRPLSNARTHRYP